jgi:mannose-6-phosphate isomerase-like protein (cupin superfamily)
MNIPTPRALVRRTGFLRSSAGRVALIAVVALAIAVPAAATPGSDITGPIIARGLADQKIKTRGNQPYDVVVQHITIQPGGYTGWHTHPGSAIAVVTTGTLTIYDADDATCTGRDFDAGEVYLDPGYGHVHLGRNEGTTPLEIYVTYIDVPIGGGVREDAPDPGKCSF